MRAILILALLSSMVLLAEPGIAVSQGSQANNLGVTSIVTTINLAPAYDFYGFGVSQVQVTVNGTGLRLFTSQSAELIGNFRPSSVKASMVVHSITGNLPVVVIPGRSGVFYSYDFVLPSNATSFLISIQGSTGGNSFLWRYITNVPGISFNGWNGPLSPLSDGLTISIPYGNEMQSLYDTHGNSLPFNFLISPRLTNGSTSYTISSGVATMIVVSQFFAPAAISVTIVAAFAIVLVAFGFFKEGKLFLSRLAAIWRQVLPLSTMPKLRIRVLFQPRTLLVLFLLCAIFMVALGVAAGPDPRVKAYVISDPSDVQAIQSGLTSISGNVAVVTPAQDYTDFATMSSVGQFNLVVVSNYPSLALPSVSQYVLGSLSNVPLIIVDKTADANFANQIAILYQGRILHVQNAASLNQSELQSIGSLLASSARTNALGLQLGVTQFKFVLGLEGVLSFLIIFLGWAYLGSLVADSGVRSTLVYIGSVIAAGVFVFVFSELTYIQVSSLLAFPLSLHAVISGAKDITAVGLLGFGGGSTPRLAAGFLGVGAGIFASESRPPLHGVDFAVLTAVPLVMLANPFFVGNFAYEVLLLFVGNYAFGTAFTTSLSFKGFIYGVGAALGGGVSGTYLLSAGKMLYFAGIPLLAYLRALGRTTVALGVLACAFMIGDGGVRVGEMTPTKTFVAVLPGLFVGFAIAGLFLGMAVVEKYARGMRS